MWCRCNASSHFESISASWFFLWISLKCQPYPVHFPCSTALCPCIRDDLVNIPSQHATSPPSQSRSPVCQHQHWSVSMDTASPSERQSDGETSVCVCVKMRAAAALLQPAQSTTEEITKKINLNLIRKHLNPLQWA